MTKEIKTTVATAKIVPLTELPAIIQAQREVDRVQGIVEALRGELELCDLVANEEVDASAAADAIFSGQPVPATAVAAPPCRASNIVASELAAAETALARKHEVLQREKKAAIASELAKTEHAGFLRELGRAVADAMLATHKANLAAQQLATELRAAGFEIGHPLVTPCCVIKDVDNSLTHPQSLLRAMGLRIRDAGLIDATHPVAVALQSRD